MIMGCSDISLNRWVVARETVSTATYNKIQYKVGGIIQLRRGRQGRGKPRNEKDVVIFSVPIETAGSKSRKRMC